MPEKRKNANELHAADGERRQTLTRRSFFGAGLGAIGVFYAGGVAYPVYRYLADPALEAEAMAAVTEVSLADAGNLPAGQALMFKFGVRPAILIHLQSGDWVAYDAVCTHLGCTVEYQPERDRIHCACHGGEYETATGKNIAGPPPKPLRQFRVEALDAEVIVSRL